MKTLVSQLDFEFSILIMVFSFGNFWYIMFHAKRIYERIRFGWNIIFLNCKKCFGRGRERSADMKSNLTTLCYIERDGKYLMMHRTKKEGDINRDKWVGVGGHFEPDESPEECLLREVKEETGLLLTEYRLRGVVTFLSDRWQTEYMFLYTAVGTEGELPECEEGTLEWVDKSAVYALPIWEGDKIFFRLLETRESFFSLKLRYEGDLLKEALLDGMPAGIG